MKKILSIITTLTILLLLPIQNFCSDQSPQKKSILDSPEAQFMRDWSYYLAQQSAGEVVWVVKSGVTYATKPQQGQQQIPTRTTSFGKRKSTYDSNSDASSIESNSDSEEDDIIMIPIAGQTDRHFYRSQKELQETLADNPNSAINKLNRTLQQHYESPEARQKDIHYMFELLKESSSGRDKKPLTITPIIADQYKRAQKELLIARIQAHAEKLAQNKKEYEDSTTQAESKKQERIKKAEAKCTETLKKVKTKYDSQVGRSLTTIKVISENSAFINSSATIQEDHPAYSQDIFKTQEAFTAFMAKQVKQEATTGEKKKRK